MPEYPPLVLAGRVIPDAVDRVRRYCGLGWSGGSPEVWAWQYYDSVPSLRDSIVTPVDVLTAASLHPGLSRADLAFFIEHRDALAQWLDHVPVSVPIDRMPQAAVEHLESLTQFDQLVSVTLLSKVLHRKRPLAIPLVDRHVLDWYRPFTGERSAARAWRGLLWFILSDLSQPHVREALGAISRLVERELKSEAPAGSPVPVLHPLRALDVAVWMHTR